MSEIKREVKTYLVDYICDEEGCGLPARPTGIVFSTHPMQYPHKCENGHLITFYEKRYPEIRHEER